MSGETSQSRNFYESISSFWPLDIQTAASLGDVSYFAKYDSGWEISASEITLFCIVYWKFLWRIILLEVWFLLSLQ